jgi:hypothetical protein
MSQRAHKREKKKRRKEEKNKGRGAGRIEVRCQWGGMLLGVS